MDMRRTLRMFPSRALHAVAEPHRVFGVVPVGQQLAQGVRVVNPVQHPQDLRVGFDPVFGARPLKRVIQDKIENNIAEKILRNEVKPGDVIKIDEQDIV